MDPNSFSSNPNQVPQEFTPSMAIIPEDPFISPLYEAMFPFGTIPTISTTITPYNLSFDTSITADPPAPPPTPMFSIGEYHDLSYSQLVPTTDITTYVDTQQPGYFMSLLNSDFPATYPDPSSFPLHCPSQSSSSSYQQSSEEVAPDQAAFDNNTKVTEDPNDKNHKSTCNSYTYSKYKYVCEPCRVYFSTPQALGGHMSYHSKERKGIPIAPIRRSSAVNDSAGKTDQIIKPAQPKQHCNIDDKGKDTPINIDINDDDDVFSAVVGEINLDVIPWGSTQVEFNNLMEEEGEKEATVPNHEDLQLIMNDVDVNAMINEMFVDFDCTFDN